MPSKRGQVALFVIISLFLIGTIFLIYYFVNLPTSVPSKLRPLDDQLKSCIRGAVDEGTMIMGEQGGYIIPPAFEAGSEIYPSTSQLNFFGSTMPFWFYISGNGINRNQVPSITGMEKQLADYVDMRVKECDFSDLQSQGYLVLAEQDPSTRLTIREASIEVQTEWPVTLALGNTRKRITSQSINVKSNFGKNFDIAKEIFENENSRLFLEEYTIDSISLSAPTTDVTLGCSPQIWSKQKVSEDIKNSLALNLPTIKFSGAYYKLTDDKRKYFIQQLSKPLATEQVNIIYDKTLPTYLDISPSDGDVMRADPVGLQQGMEMMGFCYTTYHFVYSMNYPVIIQVFDGKNNLFQFPMIVQIKNNKPRDYVSDEQPETMENAVCQYPVQSFEVKTVDRLGNALDSDISLKCAGAVCPIGKTENGYLNGKFPQCVNGFILAKTEGYATAKTQVSTDQEGSVEIPMSKIYTLDLEVLANANQLKLNDTALVTFVSDDYTESAYYPLQKTLSLPEGNYQIQAYLFREGKITLNSQQTEKCVAVPRDGIMGLLGFQRDECYTIDIPPQELTQITIGGGALEQTIGDDELRQSNMIEISIPAQAVPKTMEELQTVYSIIGQSSLNLNLK